MAQTEENGKKTRKNGKNKAKKEKKEKRGKKGKKGKKRKKRKEGKQSEATPFQRPLLRNLDSRMPITTLHTPLTGGLQ